MCAWLEVLRRAARRKVYQKWRFPSSSPGDHVDVLCFQVLQPLGGMVLFAPLRLRIGEGKVREPDTVALRNANDPRRTNRFWLGADLVVEVVSPDDPERDTITKRREYAEAGIPAYWIADPKAETVTVLRLQDERYAEHGVFERGDAVTSMLLESCTMRGDAVFDAANA